MTRVVRVGVWGTGAVGQEAVRGIVGAPALELVGARVVSPEKDGVDVGALVGLDPLGVPATTSTPAFLDTRPDVVVYAPRTPSVDEVCELLRAGIDVATTAFCFHPARTASADVLRQACLQGGATLHGSGLNPGGFSGAVPLALSGLVRSLRSVTLTERADWSVYESTRITFDLMLFGRPPADVREDLSDTLAFNSELFRQQVWLMGDALGADLDEVVTHHDVAVAAADQQVFDRVLPAGTVNAQRWRWAGVAGGVERVVIDAMWTVGPTDADWPRTQHGWTLVLEGDPSVQAHLMTLASASEPRSLEEHVRAASAATAMQVVNAIPSIHAAPPGFATAADLPLPRSLKGFR
jgi:hypothetical protein